jgi:hypothetical protein
LHQAEARVTVDGTRAHEFDFPPSGHFQRYDILPFSVMPR